MAIEVAESLQTNGFAAARRKEFNVYTYIIYFGDQLILVTPNYVVLGQIVGYTEITALTMLQVSNVILLRYDYPESKLSFC